MTSPAWSRGRGLVVGLSHDLRELSLSMRAIARRLNVNFKTVRRYVRASSADVLVAGGVQVSVLDPFKPYLNDRLAEGVRNVTMLLGEITEQGYTGSYNTLNRYVRPLRRLDAAQLAELPPRPAPPAVRKVTGWITGLPGNLDPDDAERLHAIRQRCPELDAAVNHVAGFARMIKDLSGDENTLTKWIGAVDADLPALRSFTAGLRRDQAAVVRRTDPGVQLRRRRRHRQPHQAAEGRDVRPRQTRPAPQADTARLKQLWPEPALIRNVVAAAVEACRSSPPTRRAVPWVHGSRTPSPASKITSTPASQKVGQNHRAWKTTVLMLGLLVVVIGVGIWRDPYTSAWHKLTAPSAQLPFGADASGRDLLARVANGAASTIGIALVWPWSAWS